MIWIPTNRLQPPDGCSLSTHVREVLAEYGGEAPVLSDPGMEAELASAVAEYVYDTSGGDDAGLYVESDYLVLLASRALRAVGEPQAAQRVLVFGTGLVRPSAWRFCGHQQVWTLDLGQITLRADAVLEWVLFASLNLVLNAVAPVWDDSGGEGLLGLRGMSKAVHGILPAGHARQHRGLMDEICHVCRERLSRIAVMRGWTYTPRLLMLEDPDTGRAGIRKIGRTQQEGTSWPLEN